MALDKKEYEDKMDQTRKGNRKLILKFNLLFYISLELRDSRNEYDALEKRLEAAQEEQQKCLNEFKEKVNIIKQSIFLKFVFMFSSGRNI